MPFRFKRSIGIAKGLKLNLGKRGASFSVGGKGATINVSSRGTRSTIGIPGSGLSYSQTNNSNTDLEENNHQYGQSKFLDFMNLLIQGSNLLISLISLIGSCIVAGFFLYLLIVLFSG